MIGIKQHYNMNRWSTVKKNWLYRELYALLILAIPIVSKKMRIPLVLDTVMVRVSSYTMSHHVEAQRPLDTATDSLW